MQRHRLLALAFVAAGLMAYTAPAAAQGESRTPSSAPADTGRRMYDPVSRILDNKSQLKLSDEQTKRLEAIRSKYMATNQTRMEEFRRDREKRAAFQARVDSTRKEAMAVLTPEQQKQVEQMRKEWRKEYGHHRGHGSHDDHKDTTTAK